MYSSAIRINPNELLNASMPGETRAEARINGHEYPRANAREVGHNRQSLFRGARRERIKRSLDSRMPVGDIWLSRADS